MHGGISDAGESEYFYQGKSKQSVLSPRHDKLDSADNRKSLYHSVDGDMI